MAAAAGRQDRVTSLRGWWTSPDHNPDGAGIRVGAAHRKLSTFQNALLDAGLDAERFVEPPAPVPAFLLWRCRPADRQPGHTRSPTSAASAAASRSRTTPATDFPPIGLPLTWIKKENVQIVGFAPRENELAM